MKGLEYLRFSIVVFCLFNLSLTSKSNGEEEEEEVAPVSVSAPMKKTEREALYSAIQGFVGKWWNGSDLYPDPCGWTPIQGVSCDLIDGFWYVTELKIGPVHDNSLSCAENVQFARQVFDLMRLRTLSFFSCFISRHMSIPVKNWEALAGNLESLEFRFNSGLTGEVPATFGKLKKLQSLVVMGNGGLTGELPSSIGNLTKLRRLNLAGNSLTGRIPESLGALKNLLILDMSSNSLSGFLPDSIGNLVSLLKLDLSNNNLEGGIIPDGLRNLKNLTLLDLRNNRFSGRVTKSVQELKSLQELALSGNPTGGDIRALDWEHLVGLTVLDLANMSLTGGIPGSITKLNRLRFLGLNDNKLTGDISPDLANLPDVSAIYIHGNNLTGQLKFSAEFYRKMGRRFGAWGNPNLCCPMGLVSDQSVLPFGVKMCEETMRNDEGGIKDSRSRVENGSWDQEYSASTARIGASVLSLLVFLVEVVLLLLFIFLDF